MFLTDGAIGNEQQLFETINAMRGRSRIFMVGIGSAPNTYLMTRAAELGRGTFTHIGSVEQVEERMRGLFAKLENPAVTNLTAKFSDAAADITPAAIPDLYRDEPLVLAAKLDKLAGSVEIKGRIGDRPWVVTLAAGERRRRQGPVQTVGAPQDRDAEVARTTRQASPEDADKTILALALEHQLVTRLTSLVAVDKTPSRPEGEPLKVAELPINLPAGWDFAKGVRRAPATAGSRRPNGARMPSEAQVQVAALKRAQPASRSARHGHAAEDGDRCRTEDDRGCDPAHAQPDPVRVQSASDVSALTPAEKRRRPHLLLQSARGLPVPQGRARDFFSNAVIASEAKQSISLRNGRLDCFASLAMTTEHATRCPASSSPSSSPSPASSCSARAPTSTPRRCSRRSCWSGPLTKPSPPAARQSRGHGRIPGRSRASK